MIVIDEEKCNHCDLCTIPCPVSLIEKGPRKIEGADNFCLECGHCVAVCPSGSISLAGFEDVDTRALSKKKVVDKASLMAFMKGRRSGRSFKPGPVSREDMEEIIEAASNAPSANNARSTKAYVCRDAEVIQKIRKRARFVFRIMNMLLRFPGFSIAMKIFGLNTKELDRWQHAFGNIINEDQNRDKLLHNTETLLFFSVSIFHPASLLADAWLAAEHAVLYAESIHVASCYIGVLGIYASVDPAVRKALGVPWHEIILPALAMGYPMLKYTKEAPRKTMPIEWIGPNKKD